MRHTAALVDLRTAGTCSTAWLRCCKALTIKYKNYSGSLTPRAKTKLSQVTPGLHLTCYKLASDSDCYWRIMLSGRCLLGAGPSGRTAPTQLIRRSPRRTCFLPALCSPQADVPGLKSGIQPEATELIGKTPMVRLDSNQGTQTGGGNALTFHTRAPSCRSS